MLAVVRSDTELSVGAELLVEAAIQLSRHPAVPWSGAAVSPSTQPGVPVDKRAFFDRPRPSVQPPFADLHDAAQPTAAMVCKYRSQSHTLALMRPESGHESAVARARELHRLLLEVARSAKRAHEEVAATMGRLAEDADQKTATRRRELASRARRFAEIAARHIAALEGDPLDLGRA